MAKIDDDIFTNEIIIKGIVYPKINFLSSRFLKI
jgi:hypothetical protein